MLWPNCEEWKEFVVLCSHLIVKSFQRNKTRNSLQIPKLFGKIMLKIIRFNGGEEERNGSLDVEFF